MHRHHNFYILNYIIMCTAVSIFIEHHMQPLCTPGSIDAHVRDHSRQYNYDLFRAEM